VSEAAPLDPALLDGGRRRAGPLSLPLGLLGSGLRAAARASGVGLTAFRAAGELRRLAALPAEERPTGAGAEVLSRASQKALRIHGLSIDLRGAFPAGPALYVSNHVSYLDPVVLMALRPCLPAAKREVQGWPVFGPLAKAGGVHFIERGSRRDGARIVLALAATLRAGVSALNFPEGTTSDGARTLPFRAGGFGAAAAAGVPVVPIALRYQPQSLVWTGDATFLPSYLRFSALPSSRVLVRVGEPIAPGLPERELAEQSRAVIDRFLAEP
jgi:1-acyl-sn-glycerol-3-phosphate acyltransferase